MSVNKAWQGRKYKSPAYKKYTEQMLMILPNSIDIPDKTPLKLKATFYIHSKTCDLDNFLKPLIDLLQKKYNFNDRYIYQIQAVKVEIDKDREESIEFNFEEIICKT